MKTRRPVQIPWLQSGRGFRVVAGTVLALMVAGFVYFGSIAANYQAHLPPGHEHPWDIYADACATVALIAAGVIILSLREPRGPNFQRVASHQGWRLARPDHHPSVQTRAKRQHPPRPNRNRRKYR